MKQNKAYWDRDSFEDTLFKLLILLNEDPKSTLKFHKDTKLISFYDCLPKEFSVIRSRGLYIPPGDRLTTDFQTFPDVDGFPEWASLGMPLTGNEDFIKIPEEPEEYARMAYVEKKRVIPPEFKRTGMGIPYQLIFIHAFLDGTIASYKYWATITNTGKVFPTKFIAPNFKHKGIIKLDTGVPKSNIIPLTINFFTDKKYLWNVEATEDNAKIIFGVHKEQIKSLFYARELPLTETGRKKPILHWVSAHRRRIKNGYDVNIEKHLRGTDKFIMNNTMFSITQPLKKPQ